ARDVTSAEDAGAHAGLALPSTVEAGVLVARLDASGRTDADVVDGVVGSTVAVVVQGRAAVARASRDAGAAAVTDGQTGAAVAVTRSVCLTAYRSGGRDSLQRRQPFLARRGIGPVAGR